MRSELALLLSARQQIFDGLRTGGCHWTYGAGIGRQGVVNFRQVLQRGRAGLDQRHHVVTPSLRSARERLQRFRETYDLPARTFDDKDIFILYPHACELQISAPFLLSTARHEE